MNAREIKKHQVGANQHEAELYSLRVAHSSISTFLKRAGTFGHAASARRLLEIDAATICDDLEYHLSKLREAGAPLPEGLDHSDDEVACWGCRRAPHAPPTRDACPLGAACRAER